MLNQVSAGRIRVGMARAVEARPQHKDTILPQRCFTHYSFMGGGCGVAWGIRISERRTCSLTQIYCSLQGKDAAIRDLQNQLAEEIAQKEAQANQVVVPSP